MDHKWRQFSFFDVAPIKDIHDLASPPEIFKNTPEISTVASSAAGILVADIHGSIHLLNRDFSPAKSWVAHVGGRVTHMIERRGVLVTLGVRSAAFRRRGVFWMVLMSRVGGRYC